MHRLLTRLRASAETLDILERQRIVGLLVKEILVSDHTIIHTEPKRFMLLAGWETN